MGLAQVEGGQELRVKTVYYNGTDTLQLGYALCYDTTLTIAGTTFSGQLSGIGTGIFDPRTQQDKNVAKPATANLYAFAGLVSASSAGKTGPCFIDIVVPEKGSYATAFCNVNATAGTTGLGPQNAAYSLASIADSTFNFKIVATAAETADTSGTAANKAVIWK